MKLVGELQRAMRPREFPAPRAEAPDHDLPILALDEHPRVALDWDALLGKGVQPALALGAERRLQGKR